MRCSTPELRRLALKQHAHTSYKLNVYESKGRQTTEASPRDGPPRGTVARKQGTNLIPITAIPTDCANRLPNPVSGIVKCYAFQWAASGNRRYAPPKSMERPAELQKQFCGPPRGFEPRTYSLLVSCSTPELRRLAPKLKF